MENDGQPGVNDPSEYNNINIFQWSEESYEIAITKYDGKLNRQRANNIYRHYSIN